jgi:hypothetical protein
MIEYAAIERTKLVCASCSLPRTKYFVFYSTAFFFYGYHMFGNCLFSTTCLHAQNISLRTEHLPTHKTVPFALGCASCCLPFDAIAKGSSVEGL